MKILLIQFYQIGDVVQTSHIPREIHKFNPDACIDFLTFPVNVPVIENNPHVNSVLVLNRKEGLLGMIKTIMQVRKNRYDIVMDFHNNPRSGYITFFSGAKYKVGYEISRRKFFYNLLVGDVPGNTVVKKLKMLEPFEKNFDITKHNSRPELYTSEQSKKNIDAVFDGFGISANDFVVTMSPTHKRATRRWKLKYFIQTAEWLVNTHNAKIIITSGPGEREYIQPLIDKAIKNVYIMPELKLGDFMELLSRAKFHFGNDSAPHHIATAFKVPTFVIVGATGVEVFDSPEHTYARLGLSCQPCNCHDRPCRISPEIPCMEDLTFNAVKDNLENFINNVVIK